MTTANLPPAATCTFALRFPNGEYAVDPDNWRHSTTSLSLAHLWLWPSDKSDEARATRIAKATKQMQYALPLVAVRARV